MTLYDVLEIQQGASPDEVKKAYRKLAMKHHPDKGGNSDLFKKISHAHDVLSDPQKRQVYDQTGSENGEAPGGMPFDMSDMFKNMFGQRGGGGRNMKRADFEHVIGVTLDDVYHGVKKNLKIEVKRNCFSCISRCGPCNGSGVQHVNMGFMAMEQQCGACQGAGSVSSGCPQCHFQKVTTEKKDVVVNIEPGVQNDSIIIVNGLGEQARTPDDIPGNLILRIVVKKHAFFQREYNNLVYVAKISFVDSVNGTIISIPHFDGSFKVPTQDFGVLDPRQKYKVSGKGLPGGDLYVIFDIQYPERDVRYVLSSE